MNYIDSANNTSSVKEEYYIIKNGSGIYIPQGTVVIQLEGKDTLDFLHRVSTNNLKELNAFEKKNTLFLNEKGRFIDRATLLNLENFFLLIGSADEKRKLLSWINKYIIMEDLKTKDVSNDYSLIELIGPQSESYITLLIGDEIKKLDQENVIYTHADGFPFYLFRGSKLDKYCFRLLVEKEKSDDFIKYMLENKSVFDVGMVSDETYDFVRIEKGIAVLPNEINDNYNPHETNMLDEISFNKGCYIGQEVIARLDTYDKVQRKMVGFILPESFERNGNDILFDENGNEIGEITSIASSVLFNKKIAIGFVRKKVLPDVKHVFALNSGDKNPITICELPIKK